MTSRFWTRWKSAITGRFVREWWAKRHPKTTFGEKVERHPPDRDRR